MTRNAKGAKNTAAHRLSGKQPLEREAPDTDVVRLWLSRDKADAKACLSALEHLVRSKPRYRRNDIAGYRFLGASKARRCGVDCLCMTFCLERRTKHSSWKRPG
jgi:hypothetical protein